MVLLKSIRLKNVKLNIWKNEANGKLSFSLQKLYFNKKTDKWTSSNNYNELELKTLKDLLIKYFNTIDKLEIQENTKKE